MLTRKRAKKLRKYAKDFCDAVKSDFPELSLTAKKPLLRLYRRTGYASIAIKDELSPLFEKAKGGQYVIYGNYDEEKGVIGLFNILKEKPDELKRTIRHECLHFLLKESGLPYEDSDKLFLIMAIMYDASPYMLLTKKGGNNEQMPGMRQRVHRAARN